MNSECLFDILEREREAKMKMEIAGETLMKYRITQQKVGTKEEKECFENICQKYIEERDEALQELNEARADIRKYFYINQIVPTGGEF